MNFAAPRIEKGHRLTGRTRVRHAFERLGFLDTRRVYVLQVEEEFTSRSYGVDEDEGGRQEVRWRDVRDEDLSLVVTVKQGDGT